MLHNQLIVNLLLRPKHYFSEFSKNHCETPQLELCSWGVMGQPYFFYMGGPCQVGSTHKLVAWGSMSGKHPSVPRT